MSIKLSILVATVPSRYNNYYLKLMGSLLEQVKLYDDIEIMSYFDNKKRTIGRKRNDMIQAAQGEYSVFIDDDDRIAGDYVDQIMKALYENPNTDCVVFDLEARTNGGKPQLSKYGIELTNGYYEHENPEIYIREYRCLPTHIMVYKTEISKKHGFKDMYNAEDLDWFSRAHQDIKHQTRINKVLYYYDAEYATTSETSNLSDEVITENIKKRFNL